MRFTFLVTAVSALVMAMLAFVTQMGEDSKTPPAFPIHPTESRTPGASMPVLTPISERKTDPGPKLTLAERLARDPHAALEWLLQASGGGGENSSFSVNPNFQSAVIDAANRLMRTTRSQSVQDNPVALGNFVQLWSAIDLRSAYQWVHQIPAGQVRDALMVRVAFVGSRSVPDEAASLVVEELPPGFMQEEAAMMVLHQWALKDPASAAAWVELFPDDQFRDRALQELQGITNYHPTSLATP